jgi:ABC-type branched-subunit amino acid transport system ATPase component/branched-subunit amino acid ABC-type transport system permease component
MTAVLIAAVVTGSVYGLIATGLVLTYNTSGLFNFAYGAMASVGVYLFFYLRSDLVLPLAICLPLCLLALPLLMGSAFEPFAERLGRQHLTIQVAGTIGLYLLIEAIAELLFGVDTQAVPTFLPTSVVEFLGTRVGVDQIITFAVSVVAVVALNAMLRRTRRGVEMRAVVDNSDLLSLSGGRPRVTRRIAWTISSFLVVTSMLLIAPSIGIDPQSLTSLTILAFAAAALGGFKSINIGYLGGFVIALPETLLARYINSTSLIGSLSQNLPFILLVVIILVYPKRAFIRQRIEPRRRTVGQVHLSRRKELTVGIAATIFLACVPLFAGVRIIAWAASMSTVVLLLSLGMIVNMSGQVSLCQMAFAAIGVSAFALLTDHAHLPWLIALILSGLITIPFALLLAVPAIRLSGLFLALGTFGFGYALLNMFYQTNFMFGPGEQGLVINPPNIGFINFTSGNAIYYLLLLFVVLSSGLVVALERTRCGRLLQAMADSQRGLEALGVSSTHLQMLVFALSAFLAGIAGVLLGVAYSVVSGFSYFPDTALLYFVVLVIIVARAPWFALIAAVGIAVLPTYYQGNINYYLQVVFSLSAVLIGLGWRVRAPQWLEARLRATPRSVRRTAEELLARSPGESAMAGAIPAVVGVGPAGTGQVPPMRGGGAAQPLVRKDTVSTTGKTLQVRDIVVNFGGLVALDGVSLEALPGEITGLIGPNGAGKTTLFNVCSGFQAHKSGVVLYGGTDVSRRSAAWRARQGLGRSFQQMELFDSMTVEQNVRLGRDARLAGLHTAGVVWTKSGQRHEIAAQAEEAMEICGLSAMRSTEVQNLSTGDRRLVELARCLAAGFDTLMLDEPSSGLDPAQSQRFGEVVKLVVRERGTGVLLIEHDLDLVTQVCSKVYVLDFGHVVFRGTPHEARQSEVVQVAYLGPIRETT